jgi:hypothetical protein
MKIILLSLKNLGRSSRKTKAVSTIIGGVIIFAIVFSTIATYFTFTEQATNQRAQLNLQAAEESFTVAGNLSSTKLTTKVIDTGPTSISIVGIIIGNESTNLILQTNTISPPVGLNPGGTANITCGGSCFTYPTSTISEVWIKAISSLGTVNEIFYPVTTVVPQAVVAGTVGDLLMNFSSYDYYSVVTTGCASGSGNSGYCFPSTGASASIIPITNVVVKPPFGDDQGCGDYDSDDPQGLCQAGPIAFSVQVTDLNPNQKSIVLDQFTILYQAPTSLSGAESGSTPAAFIPWYIVSTSSSAGTTQILSQYTPIALAYNVPTTIYFAANSCVADSYSGQNPPTANCQTLSSTLGSQIQTPPSSAESSTPYLSTAGYVLTSGWEYTNPVVSSLTYASANYGQDLPYISSLFESNPTLAIDPTSGPPLTVIDLSSGIGYIKSTPYNYCLSSSSTTVSCVTTAQSFTTTTGGSIPTTAGPVTVPAATPYGNYYVIVYQGTTVEAFYPFQVTVTLTINPTASSAPTTISMTGSGYANALTYYYCLSTTPSGAVPTCATTPAQTFTSTATGTIPTSAAVIVPSSFATAYGTYYVVISPTAIGNVAIVSAQFTIPPPTLNISPNSGSHTSPPLITLTGSGFATNTVYTYCMSGPQAPPTFACGTTHTFTTTGTGAIPTGTTFTPQTVGAANTYYVLVYIGTTIYAYAIFTYT